MNHQSTRSQRHVYFLQVDPTKISSGSAETQVVPLHILENNLEYDNEEYMLPLLQDKHTSRTEQLQLLIEPHQEPVKSDVCEIDYGKSYHSNCEISPNSFSSIISQNVYSEPISTEGHSKSLLFNSSVSKDETKTSKSPNKKQTQNYVHISDRQVPPRAVAVLPSALQIRRNGSISPRRSLPGRVRFGPLQGVSKKINSLEENELILIALLSKTPLFLIKKEDDTFHINVSDKDKANWLSLLPLGDQNTANVWLYEENNELYGITTESIAPRVPLKLGYSKKYAEDHKILVGHPILDLEAEFSVRLKQWWCNECNRAMPTAAVLQRHVDVYHKEEVISAYVSRQRYRCRYCTRTFSRLFTLRRHTAHHCLKKSENSKNKPEGNSRRAETLHPDNPKEDTRIPSDESFQNFTNSLDFSTNLFDTDRISSLDISGTSRTENELNYYMIGYKDESILNSDLEFLRLDHATDTIQSTNKEKPHERSETLLVSCNYCNQVMTKEKKRKHLSKCPNRRFECECGRIFNKKLKLAHHIHKDHPPELKSKTITTPSVETKSYKCEKCQQCFKRRGMLVNHLWRIHNTVSTTVPLERRVRHYPCVVCPKIYRTAAKRDRHVKVHHPGAEKLRGQSIEGGVRACVPAACAACPRQYATRAKMLQHMRAHHPHLASALKKKSRNPKFCDEIELNQTSTSQATLDFNKYLASNDIDIAIGV